MGGQEEQIESTTHRISTYLKAELHRIQDEQPLREIQILNAIASSADVKTKLQEEFAQLLTRQEETMSKSSQYLLQTPPVDDKASTKQRSVARRPLRKANVARRPLRKANERGRRVGVPRSA
jgi:hypothetical protein